MERIDRLPFRWVALIISAILVSGCNPDGELKGSLGAGDTATLTLETKPDGSGNPINVINLEVGQSLKVYAIQRSPKGDYLDNLEVSWIINGGLGALNIDASGKFATFTASSVGSGEIKVTRSGITLTTEITVTPIPNPKVTFSTSSQSIIEGSAFSQSGSWQGSNWLNRRKVLFSNSAQAENLVDFPVMIKLNKNSFDYTKTKDAGEDLRFFDPDGATLSHEIEEWNENGDSTIWVKVPQVDGSSNSDFIWMYYNNAAATDAQNPADVWSNGYAGVFHLGSSLKNSAGTSPDATASGSIPTVDSIRGKARLFAGVHFLNLSNDPDLKVGFPFSISAWAKRDSTTATNTVITTEYSASKYAGAHIDLSDTSIVGVYNNNGGGCASGFRKSISNPTTTNSGNWVNATIVHSDANTRSQYKDGVLLGSTSVSGSASSINYGTGSGRIGMLNTSSCGVTNYFKGLIDEVRISSVARSNDWVAAQHLSTSDNFSSLSPEETFEANLNPLSVTLELDHSWSSDVIVPISVSGSSSFGTDHDASGPFNVTIPSGTTTKSFSINVFRDLESEPDEEIILTMGTPTEAQPGDILVQTITINDDDGSSPQISISGASVLEGASAIVSVVLNKVSNSTVTVDFSSLDGTANQPADYTSVSGTLTFNSGETNKVIEVSTIASGGVEGAENFTVNLSNPSGATISTTSATITINDNSPPTVINDGPFVITEGGSITVSPLLNDSDSDGHSLSIKSISSHPGTAATNNGDGTITLYGVGGTTGLFTFNYEVQDEIGATSSGSITLKIFNPYTWTGSAGTGNWTDAGNWCGTVSSGSCQGDLAPPNSSQIAIFDSLCTNCNANINTNINVKGINLKADYGGILTQQSGNTITLGTSNFVQAGGTFAGGDSNITATTYNSGTFDIQGGTFTSTSATVGLRYNVRVMAGATFNHNMGTFQFTGDCGCSGNLGNIEANGQKFWNINDLRSWGVSNYLGTVKVENNLVQNLTGYGMAGSVQVEGNATILNTSWAQSTGSITLNGTGTQTLIHSGGMMPRGVFYINKSSGQVVLGSNVSFNPSQTFHIQSGSLDMAGFNLTIPGTLKLDSGTSIDLSAGSLTVGGSGVGSGPYDNGTINP